VTTDTIEAWKEHTGKEKNALIGGREKKVMRESERKKRNGKDNCKSDDGRDRNWIMKKKI